MKVDKRKLTIGSLFCFGFLISSCVQPTEKQKTFKITSKPSKVAVYLDGSYKGLTPITIKVYFKDKEDFHKLELKKYGYKKYVKYLYPNSPGFLKISLQPEEKRKIGYLLPEYKEGKVKFAISYEYGYKETIERSPNALYVQRVIQVEDINEIIGNIDEKNGILVYTLIKPVAKINTDIYIQYLETLGEIIKSLNSLLISPSPDKAKEVANYIKAKKEILKEISKFSSVFEKKIDIEELNYTIQEVYNYLSLKNVFKNLYKLQSYILKEEGLTLFDKLEEILQKLETAKAELETIKTKEFYAELWMVNLKKGFVKTKLTDSQHKWIDMKPSLTGDGKWVYFSSNRLSESFDIWRVGTSGGKGITKITFSRYTNDMSPSVDSKNSLIAYTSVPVGAVNSQIWTVKPNGTLPSQLRIGEQPNLCRDGSKIVFVRKNPATHKYQIWLMNSDGTGETLLSQDPNVNDMYPYFSPDCKWIVFTSDAGGNKDIYIMKIDGSQRTQLTTNPSVDIYPVWGDDGYIYFVSNRGLIWGIWSLKPVLNE